MTQTKLKLKSAPRSRSGHTDSYSRINILLRALLSVLTLGGTIASIFLTEHYFELRSGTAGFKSFCNIGEKVNCDLVAASSYAELIPGFPLSSFSAGWFLAFFIITLFLQMQYWRREAIRASLVMGCASTVISLSYLAIMMIKIKTVCLLCLVLDFVSVGSLLTALALRPEGFSVHKLNQPKWRVFVLIVATSVLASVGLLKTLDQSEITKQQIIEASNSVLSSPIYPATPKSGDQALASIGPIDAPITVVEYSDFQCPFCKTGAFHLNSVLNRFPNKIRVIFRNYPLGQPCNPHVPYSVHPAACEAAAVAQCAFVQGKFEPVYQELFERQEEFSSKSPASVAESIEGQGSASSGKLLNMTALKACMNSPETARAITEDVQAATLLGVTSTPTFFINGHKLEGVYPVAVWNHIIERLLAHDAH